MIRKLENTNDLKMALHAVRMASLAPTLWHQRYKVKAKPSAVLHPGS